MGEVYALDKNNNYFPTMTREEILAAIQTAAEGGSFEGFDNCAFVSCIREQNKGASFSVWVGTSAEYNALDEIEQDMLYLISDDPMHKDLPNMVNELIKQRESDAEIIKALSDNNFALSEEVTAVKSDLAEKETKLDEVAAINATLETANAELEKELEALTKKHNTEVTSLTTKINNFTPQLIYYNSAGAKTCKTTKPITAFHEIVIVYAVKNLETNGERIFELRCVAADVPTELFLRGAWPSTISTGEIICDSNARCKVTKYANDTLFIVDQFATIKFHDNLTDMFTTNIKKIYGLGLK